MQNQILDYSEYSSYIYRDSPLTSTSTYYHGYVGICPFCHTDANEIYNKNSSFAYNSNQCKQLKEIVWQCSCGWWQIEFRELIDMDPDISITYETIHSSQLRKFMVGDKKTPIDILSSYIAKNEYQIYLIHDKKMEELVASIFKEHFQCDVKLVGKSHDGGIDLIMIESDKQTVIQVKRRKSPAKTEGVKKIRDLLGSTLLSSQRRCIFVTTADHFSPEAVNTRNVAIREKIVDSFELYDVHRFFDMLHLYKKSMPKYWVDLLQYKDHLPM